LSELSRADSGLDRSEVVIPDKEAWRFVFLPGVSHAIKNLGGEANILVAFNTVEHNPREPDTSRDLLI
jgi:UDP-2-acetamido-2,6-beta-L-arabino-hexul-4-ose reductase